jgi:hypothetical protein
MTARKGISHTSPQPLFTFGFAAPGASGVVFIDKQKIKTFKDEQRVLIYADVSPGNHQFYIQLDKPDIATQECLVLIGLFRVINDNNGHRQLARLQLQANRPRGIKYRGTA